MGKNKKERRKKLRSLILLLFITIIMFGTSTYAWFTANRTVTIQSLDVHVEASNGIQISTDGENWKSVITNLDITTNHYSGAVNQVPTNVTAVSTDPFTVTSAGRLNMFSAIVDTDATTGKYTIETVQETDTDGEEGKYIAFDIFLRVDTDQAVYLTPASDVVSLGATDRGLKNAARVAFINLGHTASTSTVNTIVGLNTGTGSTVKLWEPNVEAHEGIIVGEAGVAHDMGVSLTQTDGVYNRVPYTGVIDETTDPLDLKEVVNGTDTSVTTDDPITPTITTTSNNQATNLYDNLQAGITKYRIYMWIEGQDIDCDNYATGTNISYNIELTTVSPSGAAASSASPSSGS